MRYSLELKFEAVRLSGAGFDADLGGNIEKKRVALPGRGKSGGVRTLVATRRGTRWFFVFGFEKNDRANISDVELDGLHSPASDLLARNGRQLDETIAEGILLEICHDHKN